MRRLLLASAVFAFPALAFPGLAQPLAPVTLPVWKSVQATIETRDRLAARARLGGTLVALTVTEGDAVVAGQVIAEVRDDKLAFQQSAMAAQLAAARAEAANAAAELARAQNLSAQGVTTAQRLDALKTAVEVAEGQVRALEAQRHVIDAQVAEGRILAPVAGRVISVPVAKGAVLMPGEAVAEIAGGGTFLRLAVPERHASRLKEGDVLQIEGPGGPVEGRLVKLYPLIQSGRVEADVEVPGLAEDFVSARVLVRLPIGTRPALVVPASVLVTRQGLDFVTTPQGERLVLPGDHLVLDGQEMVEILSGLQVGDEVAK